MSEPKGRRSPIKNLVKVFSRSPLRTVTSRDEIVSDCKDTDEEHDYINDQNIEQNIDKKIEKKIDKKIEKKIQQRIDNDKILPKIHIRPVEDIQDPLEGMDTSSMEDLYFHDASSRNNLSSNPGERLKHMDERTACTRSNWEAEIDRRGACSQQVDFAYPVGDPRRYQAYGNGDGMI